ncbi:MAG: hypothetical protein ACOX3Q_15430 [Clostridia bacterium]|nr:hypothetical protein [Clostridiaceae bacterium]
MEKGFESLSEDEIGNLVEDLLAMIKASDPKAYIQAHQEENETIIKLGGEKALSYMLSQFEEGNAEGLYIMMELCKDILGVRNNVSDETLSPWEWYEALSIRKKI